MGRNSALWLLEAVLDGFSVDAVILEICAEMSVLAGALVRDHKFHSPKEYGFTPNIWKRRGIRDSRPDLRAKWYASAVPLREYAGTYVCPELLVPTQIDIKNIRVI